MPMPVYNPVEFPLWERENCVKVDGVTLHVNEFADRPIVMALTGQATEGTPDAWMTPDEALELAYKLIEAVRAVNKAGLKVE